MATSDGIDRLTDSPAATDTISLFIRNIFLRDQINSIGKFDRGNSVSNHLSKLNNIFQRNQITAPAEKCNYLLDSLNENVKHEIFAQFEYADNSGDFEWMCTCMRKLYSKRYETTVGTIIDFLNLKQRQGETLPEFVSRIRIEGYNLL